MDFFIFSALLNAFVAGLLGIEVYLKNKKEIINKLFLAMSFAVVLWSLSYWQWMSSMKTNDAILALLWSRLLAVSSLFIPVFYFHWVINYLNLSLQKRKLIKFIYLIILIILIFSFSDWFIKGVEQRLYFKFWPVPGILYTFYLFFIYLGLIIYSLFILWKHYEIEKGLKKSTIRYIILGSILGFGGGATNFLLWYNIPVAPYGNILVFVYPVVLALASFRYGLFNIKVIATELLIFSAWIFALIRAIISELIYDILINSAWFLILVILGILIIRSVLKEVKTREQMEKLAEELGVANEKLKRLDQAKTEFISIASHQLRSPLTAIKGYSSMILEGSYGKIGEKVREVLDKIFISSNRLVYIIGDFLDVSQIELGKMQYEFTDFDIGEMVKNLVEEFKVNNKNRNLEINFENGETEKIMAKADYNKIRQICSNIIDNAVKYTDKGFVKVSLVESEQGKTITITVKDSGRGMEKNNIGKIFQKFSRSEDAAKSHTQGSGLGLYVASEMIKAHNGRVWAESEGIGKGSMFFIELPKKFITP